MISKEEMTQYFLGAYQSLKRIFKHNFQECSYLSPTYCDHCKGRPIGYVRQGYKCKGVCGLYIVSFYTLIKVTIWLRVLDKDTSVKVCAEYILSASFYTLIKVTVIHNVLKLYTIIFLTSSMYD